MADSREHTRTLSLHLSRTLDEIGLSTLTVERRRKTFSFWEHLHTATTDIKFKDFVSCYHFGSQTEGSTTPGLKSDLDTVFCNHKWVVLQDWSGWQRGKYNVLMLEEDSAPGYVRLQLLKSDTPMACDKLMNEYCTYDSSGRVILKNTWLTETMPKLNEIRHGPAKSRLFCSDIFSSCDLVKALHCSSWVRQAEEFISRPRRHGWPSKRLVQQVISNGILLVPVGHKLSPTESLEWRISASLAERHLMFSLTTVHLKCYVVLKMLMKSFVEPQIENCISSYHCKTAMLYCVENTKPEFWRDDNLIACVTLCLRKLLTWVTEGFCPQFIISTVNLFDGKVTVHNTDSLRAILAELIDGTGRALLHVSIDELGTRLGAKLKAPPTVLPDLGSKDNVELIGRLDIFNHDVIERWCATVLLEDVNSKTENIIYSVCRKIEHHKDGMELYDTHDKKIVQSVQLVKLTFLSCWLGSLLASQSLARKLKVPRQAIWLLRSGAKYDIAIMLKMASTLYCSGDLGKVATITQTLENHLARYPVKVICECISEKSGQTPTEFFKALYSLRKKRSRERLFAHCVKFSPQEIHCMPPALRHELYRSSGDMASSRDPGEEKWMALAVVDCLPYLYFLQCITYGQLGKHDMKKRALTNLVRCVQEEHGFRHLETAWNLLGQCWELQQEAQVAKACYETSLEIRPKHNAAIWHLQTLRYMAIRQSQQCQ